MNKKHLYFGLFLAALLVTYPDHMPDLRFQTRRSDDAAVTTAHRTERLFLLLVFISACWPQNELFGFLWVVMVMRKCP